MLRVGMVGLGKMGISHLAIFRAHPKVRVVAACDKLMPLNDVLQKHTGLKCYADYRVMLTSETLDAVVISTPSRLHAVQVGEALARDLHVFCEKPFVLDVSQGAHLVDDATHRKLVTQVGYHLRFVGSFREAARIVHSGALGDVHHVRVEAYGPVVLRATGSTWRSTSNEGGGALYDYACHAIDAVNYIFDAPTSVSGIARRGIFSQDVDDEIYCTLHFPNGASGQLCVNWSDESFRKMSTKVAVWGTNGRLIVDRQECQLYLRQAHPALPDVSAGWTVRYTTELTSPVWYYLRGEEYSAQVDYFVQSVELKRVDGVNSFSTALQADRVVDMILAGDKTSTSRAIDGPCGVAQPRRSWFRLFGGA